MVNAITQSPSEAQQKIQGAEKLKVITASVVGAASAAVMAGSRFIADKKYKVKGLRMHIGTAGTAGATTAVANVDGVAVTGLTVTIGNADPDGSLFVDGPTNDTFINPGQVVDLELTAVATANADPTVQLILAEVLSD